MVNLMLLIVLAGFASSAKVTPTTTKKPTTTKPVPPPQCGVTYVVPSARPGPQHRIVGGTEAKANSYPWMASVQTMNTEKNKLQHFCGATLIRANDRIESSDILITAAHCLFANPSHILLGAHSLSRKSSGQQLVTISQAVPHPSFNSQNAANDIAILKLQKPVKFSKTIQPACLPAGETLPEGTQGIVSGWGLLKDAGGDSAKMQYPDKLQQAVIPISNLDQCIARYKFIQEVNGTIQFCAGYPQGLIDSCGQDSGGPYVVKNAQGRFVLQGVVSFGEGCALPGIPGVYDMVSSHLTWIKDQVKALTSVK